MARRWSALAGVLILVCAQNSNLWAEEPVTPDQPEEIAVLPKRGFKWIANKKETKPRSHKRNNLFYVGEPVVFDLERPADHFEVRDYGGQIVAHGAAGSSIHCDVTQPGWYKLYVFGKPVVAAAKKAVDPLDSILDGPPKISREQEQDEKVQALWGDTLGTATFVVFRSDPNFPTRPSPDDPRGTHGSGDQVMRGIVGMGPQRHSADAEHPDESIAALDPEIAIDKEMYLPFDPIRKRALMIAFGGGTKNLAGVRKIVEHFKDSVLYWEPRNEPNYGASPAGFVENELKPFYETVKAVDPKLRVIGPGTVSYNATLLPWIRGFLEAGGARYLDGFSFHAYNCVGGDVWLARKCLTELNALLALHGADKLEKWQTEQGFFACVYGAYQPRLQGRWTMVEMMVYEQFGLPKEHNHLWYDRSHGFWAFPTWWENNDGSLNPAAPLMRVWSEELFGTQYERAFDFGPSGNTLYIGSLFTGPGKQMAAFMSAGSTDGRVTLRVHTGSQLRVVSAFGAESTIPVTDSRATLSVPELPVYVHLEPGQQIEVEPCNWGENLARAEGVTVAAAGSPDHPTNKPDTPEKKRIANDPKKVVNGVLENWYGTLQKDDHPWMSNVSEFPAWVEVRLPKPTRIARVNIFASPPWQMQSTLVDYELQVDRDGRWVTVGQVNEPTETFKVYSPPTRTVVDSFFSDRWVFQHTFEPVTTGKIRLLVKNVTYGGGATAEVGEAGGQTGLRQIVLREIEIYGR